MVGSVAMSVVGQSLPKMLRLSPFLPAGYGRIGGGCFMGWDRAGLVDVDGRVTGNDCAERSQHVGLRTVPSQGGETGGGQNNEIK